MPRCFRDTDGCWASALKGRALTSVSSREACPTSPPTDESSAGSVEKQVKTPASPPSTAGWFTNRHTMNLENTMNSHMLFALSVAYLRSRHPYPI